MIVDIYTGITLIFLFCLGVLGGYMIRKITEVKQECERCGFLDR